MSIIQSVLDHIHQYGVWVTEGSASETQINYFRSFLIAQRSIKKVVEIGFNAGISTTAFLDARPDIEVVSFDLGEKNYISYAKEYIDKTYPNRHTLILGDSKSTVSTFAKDNPVNSFDLIFIDGGHDYSTAKADLTNMEKLANPNSVLIIDDLTPWHPWGEGPTKAWQEAVAHGAVVQDELIKDGHPVRDLEGSGEERIWGVGRYCPNS